MKKFQIPKIKKTKQSSEKLICLTAYDYFTAHILDQVGVDIILVGDTLGNVIQGNDTTISVTLEEIIYHTKIVRKGSPEGLIIIDMPFGYYGDTVENGVRNCVKAFKETGANGVKVEGAGEVTLKTIKNLIEIGVPVMGHIGFTPQSINIFGGGVIVGKNEETANKIKYEAKQLEEAGIFSIVLECIQKDIASQITNMLNIPTIGIGSGDSVDGQILVIHDLLGMTVGKLPSFVKPYANFLSDGISAVSKWKNDNLKK